MTNSEAMREVVEAAVHDTLRARTSLTDGMVAQLAAVIAPSAIAAVHAEQERQATDREAKAAGVDDIKLALRMRASSGEVSEERCEDARMFLDLLDDVVEEHRQRLNVNPNLVTIERGSVPEWMEELSGDEMLYRQCFGITE